MIDEQIDCIIRFHSIDRLDDLKRCVFSLVGQTYQPLNIILTLQRFSNEAIDEVRQALEPALSLADRLTMEICNFREPTPADARSLMLNLGLQAATGRFIAFLDYDDLLYPEAYSMLVKQSRKTNAAIVFAAVRVVWVEKCLRFVRVGEEVKQPFGKGDTLLDLFEGPFCPIHSYLIDRHRIDPADLQFNADLTWEEDYDFLLRLCAKYRSNFELIKTRIGEYYWEKGRNDITNIAVLSEHERRKAYERIRRVIEGRRMSTLISADVQRDEGIVPPDPFLTIREFIERIRLPKSKEAS